MTVYIRSPLTYVLIAGFFYIKKRGLNKNIFYGLIVFPW